jgi:hypothetical protein
VLRHFWLEGVVASLLIMGLSTLFIAFLPTYADIGWIAPALLCLLRFGQGFGLGGEWSGAALLAVENAPPGWRGRFGCVPQLGAPVGFIAANGLFLVLGLVLSPDDFRAWGWRVPFVLSIVLVGVGLWVRLKLHETPAFAAALKEAPPPKVPLAEVQALFQAHTLLFIADIEHELQDHRAVLAEVFFERVDLLVALLDLAWRCQPAHAHYQHIFIVRPVKDADISPARDCIVDAPEIVAGEFLGAGRLEGFHFHAERGRLGEDRLDRAGLAGSVHALKDHEQGTPAFGIQHVLQLVDDGGVLPEAGLGLRLVREHIPAGCVACRQVERLARGRNQ